MDGKNMKIEEVILHHKNCDIHRCSVCYEDAMRLEKYLDQETNDNNKHDLLGYYRKWLDNLNIVSENEFGWLLPSAYYQDNITDFIKHFKKLYEK